MIDFDRYDDACHVWIALGLNVIEAEIPAALKLDIYRIIQEALTNAVLFKQEWHDAGVALGKSGDITTKQIAAFNVYGFAVGILMVLTYAAIQLLYYLVRGPWRDKTSTS